MSHSHQQDPVVPKKYCTEAKKQHWVLDRRVNTVPRRYAYAAIAEKDSENLAGCAVPRKRVRLWGISYNMTRSFCCVASEKARTRVEGLIRHDRLRQILLVPA